jgi:ligand-binding sensor domain-containing protein
MLDTILFAGTQGGIYKSSDNAATWDEIGSGIPGEACITSFISGGGAIFTASSTAGVFRTTNEGANWSEINTGLTDTHISQLVVSGPKLIAVTLNGVFVSEDDGTSWEAYSSDLKNINCFIVVDGQLFAGTDSSGVYRSINNGLTWTPFSSELPPDTRIWSMAADSDTLFAGTDSGVWRIEVDLAEVHWIFLPIINK